MRKFKPLLLLMPMLLLIIACEKEKDLSVTGVTMSQSTLTLNVGGTFYLSATIFPGSALNHAVTWESSNTDIVRVNYPGHIEALALGSATITVTTEDGNKTATCTVTVAPISVTGVSLHSDYYTALFPGKTTEIWATITPYNATNQQVIWESSDTAVATVSDGTVTAVAPGSATITVTTEDGNKTATFNIVVAMVSGVWLDHRYFSLYPGSTVTLVATVTPDHAPNKNVRWVSNNAAVATVSDGTVSAVATGAATITVITEDGNRSYDCWITVVNRVEWAAANVDDYQTFAERPDMYTKFYQWNKTIAYSAQDPISPDWETTVSAATSWMNNPCPAGWRVPSPDEFKALRDCSVPHNGTWAAAGAKGNVVPGRFFGPNSTNCHIPSSMANCVFLPAAGERDSADGKLRDQAKNGCYWTNQHPYAFLNWYGFMISTGSSDLFYRENEKGALNVRCVRDIQ